MTRLSLLLVTGLALTALAHPAYSMEEAQRAVTRALVRGAVERFNQAKYKEARDDLDAALKVAQVPAIAWWAGRAHERLGELDDAAQLYSAATLMQPNELWVDKETQRQAQAAARHAFDAMLSRIQTARIVLVGATLARVEVALDGAKVPGSALGTKLPLKPGEHDLMVTSDGSTLKEKVTLATREHKTVTIDLARLNASRSASPSTSAEAASPPLGTQRIAGWTALLGGAAGLAFGATAGVIAWTKHSGLKDDSCTGGCPEGTVSRVRVDSYSTWCTVSTVGFAVGTVGAVVGVTLLLTEPKHESTPRVSLVIVPNALGVRGAF